MFWAMAALVISVVLVVATSWWAWRDKASADLDADLMRPPPPQGFANLIDAEYDFVELEIWEEVLDASADVEVDVTWEEEAWRRSDEERPTDGST